MVKNQKFMANEVETALQNAVQFLLSPHSIDNLSSISYGGFYGFQNTTTPLRETDRPFVFYEITGYGINLLLKLYSWHNEIKFLELAKKAGECLLLAQAKDDDSKASGAFYDRYYPETKKFFATFHSYPNGVCVGALCELYLQTKDIRFINSAKKATNWLFSMLEKKDDLYIGFREFYSKSKESKKVYPYESLCIPFILLKFQKELELSEKQKADLGQVISWGLRSQNEEGFFPFFYLPQDSKFNNTAYSHFTIYPLYNLMGFPLSELEKMGHSGAFDSYLKCGKWLVKVQAENGGFYTYYHKNKHVWHQQSPAVGQALCSFVDLYQKTDDQKFLDSAKKCATWLVTNQIKDGNYKGSFYWVYPNKHLTKLQKKIKYAKERLASKLSESENVSDVTILLDKVPIWPVQFAIEGLYRFKELKTLL